MEERERALNAYKIEIENAISEFWNDPRVIAADLDYKNKITLINQRIDSILSTLES
jgi:hypothetical protein